MANVGNATLIITPKFDGLEASVNKALGNVNTTQGAQSMGKSVGSNLMANGAVIGAVSSVVGRAMDAVGAHMGSAVSRLDTLKNYPQVMTSLGVSTEEADSSIQMMSNRLQNLPTRLDDMATTVQGIYAATDKYGVSLTTATEAGLALNNMLLAGGGSTQVVNSAMEQFRQMLSKGKPDMQDWKSLISAAPGQMNQLAQAMLGTEASADDLYQALGGGGTDPTITMNELLDALVTLNNEGGENITALAEQAEEAQGGIGTAFSNMGNAVTRGLADVLDAIGRENIVSGINGIKAGIKDTFNGVADIATNIAPVIKPIGDMFSTIAENAGGLVPVVGSIAAALSGLSIGNTITSALESLPALVASVNPATLAIVGLAAAAGTLFAAFKQAKDYENNFTSATKGLSDAVRDALLLDEFADGVDDLGLTSNTSALSVRDLAESMANFASTVSSNNEAAQSQIAQLNEAQNIIGDYAGKTDLSAEAQGRLQWALAQVNEEFGLGLTAQDVAQGYYEDTDGVVHDLTQSVNDLIEAKKKEIQLSVLEEDMTEAYKARQEAAKTLAKEQDELAAAEEHLASIQKKVADGEYGYDQNTVNAAQAQVDAHKQAVENATAIYDEAEGALSRLSAELGDTARQAEEGTNAYDAWANSLDEASAMAFELHGTSLAMLKDDLSSLGVSTTSLAQLTNDDLASMARAYDGTIPSLVNWINEYNAQNVNDKESQISVDTYELIDANGNVVVWNGTQLVDKNTGIKAEYGELKDALGNVYTWNGTQLLPKYASASVDTSSVKTGIDFINKWNNTSLNYKNAVATTTIQTQYENRGGSGGHYAMASGGFRTHADGGFRYHAGGSIVNVPGTGYPLDWVGEDGAEAIVPLTNKKYAQPFIDMLAKGVQEEASQPVVNNYTIGSLSVPADSELARYMELVFAEAKRLKRMV